MAGEGKRGVEQDTPGAVLVNRGLESLSRVDRVAELCRRLPQIYPDARCELNFSSPLELLVATVLSAQCSDVQVNKVTSALFPKYPTARYYAESPPGQLEADIQSIGLFRNKARNLRAACRILVESHRGQVPHSMAALQALPGVGRKTANVVLGNVFDLHEGVVVDTHVARLSQRLGLTRQSNPAKIEAVLIKLVPRKHWTMWAHWLIFHGRRRCKAQRPDCVSCELRDICPRVGVSSVGSRCFP
jgi:endonuclease-3